MESQVWSVQRYEKTSQACGMLTAIIGGSALVGWFIDSAILRGIKSTYIPMAPNTAILFIVLGLLLASIHLRRVVIFVRVGALVTVVLSGLRVSEYITGTDLAIDRIFFRFPSENLGLAPVGKMALFTAATFLLVGIGIFLLSIAKHWANDVAKAISVVISFIGLTFSLGYCYGAPLMYGGESIPMALNTALCFFVLGAGLLVKGSIHDLKERRLAAETLRKAHDQLETRIRERTAELSEAIASLKAEITEREQAEDALREKEEQLRQSQKMEAVGQLAGGVAHDFNNQLTVIMGYSDMLLRQEDLETKVQERLIEIQNAGKRASSLTRQLLAFSRKQVLKPELLELNSLIEGTGKMLRRLIGEDIQIVSNLTPDVGTIKADPGQVEQVLINLVVNARDAMPRGGTITIQTANVELDRVYTDLHFSVRQGHYVMLAVSDTGSGMDAETRKRIFEPFFTTKELGKGTGLGLSTIYGIVKQSEGNIWVYSEVGRGTTFKIYLPRVYSESAVGTFAERQHSALIRDVTETILLVEDEEMVRKLAGDMLRESGYRVLVAASGEDAVRLCEESIEPIHLVLTDVVMPRMTGKDVADWVSLSHQNTAVLYMSGYTDDAIVHHGVLDPGTNFIEKPFTAEALLTKVAEVLNNKSCHETLR